MEIRKTKLEDLDAVMALYDAGRQYMRKNGNDFQWLNGYPKRELVQEDIQNGNSYVCHGDGMLMAVFFLKEGVEPDYRDVYDGCWLDDAPYAVVHRLASVSGQKGVATYCLNWCLERCGNIRLDTHRNNVPMQSLMKKNSFSRCGVIYLEDGSERIAFQKRV